MPCAELTARCTSYQVAGREQPVVLLPGGLTDAGSWSAQAPALVGAGVRVFEPERRVHGHTPDTDEPLTEGEMVEQTVTFLRAVVRRPAHLVGWSDGAVVAARMAATAPELVERLVLVGQSLDASGRVPAGWPTPSTPGATPRLRCCGPGTRPCRPTGQSTSPWCCARRWPCGLASLTCRPARCSASPHRPRCPGRPRRDPARAQRGGRATVPGGRLAVLPGTHALPLESPGPADALLIAFLRGGPCELDLSAPAKDVLAAPAR